ncbi:MAG: sterol desaturase family protein [Bacteroidia bacterium]|nr:sterol desaturase family protein [Bacteroidia bacterium]
MHESMKYIVYVIPFFFLLIGWEMLLAYRRRRQAFRMNDSITNLHIGLGEQLLSILIKGGLFALYAYIQSKWAIFSIPFTFLYSVVLFFAFDLVYYWAHRLGHEVNFMWASHVVHHSSEEYNLTVALRQPWFQAITTSWLFLPFAFLGFPVEMFILVSAIDILYQFWIHTEYVPKLGKVIEFIFNTPSHHRVHHGINPKYLDKNHGGILIIWDRLFGTFQEEEETPVYGITTGVKSFDPLWLNTHYISELYTKSKSFKGWGNKIGNWFRPPGWRPAYAGGRETPYMPAEVHKYDVQIHSGRNAYIVSQFALLGAFCLSVIWFQAAFSVWEICLFSLLSVLHMSGIAYLFEGRRAADVFEVLRVLSYGVFLALLYPQLNLVFSIVLAVLSLASLVFFVFVKSRRELAPL